MDFLTIIKERAKKNKKTIVLPEAYERRTLDAADMILKEDIADLILIGNKDKILEAGKGCNIDGATIIDPENYEFRPAKKQVDYYDNEVEQRVAVYARVSTGNVQQTTSYELQKKYYEDFVIHHPNWTLVKIYADVDAPYGQNTKRP